MKKIIKLIDEGKSEEEIKNLCISENLFGAAKEYRAKRIYGYIWNRAKKLDKTLIDLFVNSDLATQKIINLVAILRTDRLFFEFMFEVYREKNILSKNCTDIKLSFLCQLLQFLCLSKGRCSKLFLNSLR